MMKQKSIVLIVDDQLAMRETLDSLLSNQGYELAFASDGQEALTQAAQLIPDIILLDVMMPNMDGFEVCQRMRADPTLAKVPIIMITALDDRELRLQGIEAGADDFISKPYNMLELRARVRTITNLNRYRRLLTEQAKFEWVIENADEAYLLLNDNNQILYINAKARLYLNKTKVQKIPIHETFLEVVAKDYHQVHEPQEKPLPIGSAEKKLPRYLVRLDTETAHAFWLQVNVMEMKTDSDEKYLVHLRDVTEMMLANRQRWTLQSQINHKLRTPLIALSASKLLLENFDELTEAEVKEWLGMIEEGRIRLQSEIEEILRYVDTYSMVQTSLDPCKVADIQLTIAAVKKTLDIESIQVSQRDSIDNPKNILVPISCQAMEIILIELFSNAKKFHPKGTPAINVEIVAKPESICFQVSDDGLHLSPKQLANLWIPYYQGEKYSTGEIDGMGLGLSTVASLIWEVGGTCQAYNRTENQGLVIELTLPLLNINDE
jgi:DNA-binding response OmpR family regulator